jgi:hypothetical protein
VCPRPHQEAQLALYPFAKISHWESTTLGIKFAIAEEEETVIFLCKTPFGKHIDHIITAYCAALSH